jgi:hypothetical protein
MQGDFLKIYHLLALPRVIYSVHIEISVHLYTVPGGFTQACLRRNHRCAYKTISIVFLGSLLPSGLIYLEGGLFM